MPSSMNQGQMTQSREELSNSLKFALGTSGEEIIKSTHFPWRSVLRQIHYTISVI